MLFSLLLSSLQSGSGGKTAGGWGKPPRINRDFIFYLLLFLLFRWREITARPWFLKCSVRNNKTLLTRDFPRNSVGWALRKESFNCDYSDLEAQKIDQLEFVFGLDQLRKYLSLLFESSFSGKFEVNTCWELELVGHFFKKKEHRQQLFLVFLDFNDKTS